ncbi:hypothetical protein BCR44DRAFT_1439050 [Catenaria anguillulae PL171]|uniref:S-adenosyl-L-methionine-dependent methyltransferase n=1 Tax=Catenaria anguillulae PL171 TaxID=765915 RepID=A0A1Y2HEV2_9FUNG|nr:hypothetical protein BCR44DRAFT_1439050 [Catenaria anguillulae PL171]
MTTTTPQLADPSAWAHYDGADHTAADNLKYVQAHAEQGNPASVLKAMDEFARNAGGLMHVGDDKGPIVVNDIIGNFVPSHVPSPQDPVVMVELGAFLGYSAVHFASALANKFGKAKCATFPWKSTRNVHEGPLEEHLKGAFKDIPRIDLVFIDHVKFLYEADARRLLESGKLYLKFVRSHPGLKSRHYETVLEYSDGKILDGIEVSVVV